jgi:hypothetical protein
MAQYLMLPRKPTLPAGRSGSVTDLALGLALFQLQHNWARDRIGDAEATAQVFKRIAE